MSRRLVLLALALLALLVQARLEPAHAGDDDVVVPDVMGRSRSDAERAVKDAGLRPMVMRRNVDAPEKVGVVVQVEPTAGSKRSANTLVILYVGKAAPGMAPAKPARSQPEEPPKKKPEKEPVPAPPVAKKTPAKAGSAVEITPDDCLALLKKVYAAIGKKASLEPLCDVRAMAQALLARDPLEDVPSLHRLQVPAAMHSLAKEGLARIVAFHSPKRFAVSHVAPLEEKGHVRITALIEPDVGATVPVHWWMVERGGVLRVIDYALVALPLRASDTAPIMLRAMHTGKTDFISSMGSLTVAQAYLDTGLVTEARREVESLGRSELPPGVENHVRLLQVQLARLDGMDETALALLEQVLAAAPDTPVAYRMRAALQVKAGRHAQALKDVERYERTVGWEPTGLRIKAAALKGLGRTEQARAAEAQARSMSEHAK